VLAALPGLSWRRGERPALSAAVRRLTNFGSSCRLRATPDHFGSRADDLLEVEPSPARERARLAIRALLKEQLGPSPSEVDVAVKRGLEALLW
jgi:hypothetical protein